MIFLENLFNNCILLFFSFIYKWCKIETMEDIYHKDKKNNNKLMNKVKFEFNDKNEYESVKDNVLNIIQNNNFISKYNISTKSILENTNNKLGVSFMKNCIYLCVVFNSLTLKVISTIIS
jgi:hypothetical protein